MRHSQLRLVSLSCPLFSPMLRLLLCLLLSPALYAPAAFAAGGGSYNRPFPGDYTGVYNPNGDASGGNLYIENGDTITKDVFGGYASNTAGGNAVTINGGTVSKSVYGGYGIVGNQNVPASDIIANNNTVIVNGGTIAIDVYGGYAYNATGNTVIINGGSIQGGVNAAWADNNAIGNTAIINGGLMASATAGRAVGRADGNTLIMNNGTVNGEVIGGKGERGSSGNTVIMRAGSVYSITGGFSERSGAEASNNTVLISGGYVKNNIAGGKSTAGNAIGNTVTIIGNPMFYGATPEISGGWIASGTLGTTSSGNTINIFTSGISVFAMSYAQNYNFALYADGRTAITVKNLTFSPDGQDKVRVPYALPGPMLRAGHTMTLIETTNPMINNPTLVDGQARRGASLVYDYTLTRNSNKIYATVTGVGLAPESKALSEGRAAALAFTNLGADLVAGAGIANARAAAAPTAKAKGLSGGSADGLGLVPFFALSGASQGYNTGSHVDVNGMALMAGLAKKWEGVSADVLLGAFFEAGSGGYRAHNNINGFGKVDGSGDSHTFGGGVLARLDMTRTALRGLYAEASLRTGNLKSDYQSGDLRDFAGNSAAYDINSPYYGAHAGLGYIWNLTEKADLDLYGKYFWTHQTGQDVTILDEKFSFKDTDSQRTRLGGRLSYAVNEKVSPYIGAAYEYEFDGKARATTYGFDVPAPSLKGSTGVGELGLTLKPADATGFSLDTGVQGYAGMRQGVSCNVQLRWEF